MPRVSLIRLAFLLLLSSVLVFTEDLIAPRNPGDSIVKKCGNIAGVVNNVCVELNEAEDCGVNITLSIQNARVFRQKLDIGVVPRACGRYNAGLFPCDLCISIDPSNAAPDEMCINLAATCAGAPIGSLPSFGCFKSSVLDGIKQCQARSCPNRCSGHGTCDNGVCKCDQRYYTKDCSTTDPTWESCQQISQIPQLSGDVCLRVKFKECRVQTQLLVVPAGGSYPLTLYDNSYPVTQLKAIFQDNCTSLAGCDLCMKWDNLVLNSTDASGCGTVSLTCLGYSYGGPRSLGCFNNKMTGQCLGSCPNDCSGYGDCVRGYCKCVSGWAGDDCSKKDVAGSCPNQCSGKGRCESDGCKCTTNWGGKDCSLWIGDSPSDGSNSGSGSKGSKRNVATTVVIVLAVLSFVAITMVLVWFYVIKRRVMDSSHTFNQLDLLDDDNSGAQELEEDVK